MKINQCKPCGCTHTHTHTHTDILVNHGAKEEVESTRRVVILPRDCE